MQAEIDVINASWNPGGSSNGLADTIGLMVYEGTQALIYLKNYVGGSSMWQGFPIKVRNIILWYFLHPVITPRLMFLKTEYYLAARDPLALTQYWSWLVRQSRGTCWGWWSGTALSGRMGSNILLSYLDIVRNGLKYAETWDCSGRGDSEAGYVAAMQLYKEYL